MLRGHPGFFASLSREAGGSLPADIDEVMADIALVFHWTPESMDRMTLADLVAWREKARARWEPEP